MPVVEIRALPQAEGVDVVSVLRAVTRALAELLGEPARGTWATWLDLKGYAEGEEAATRQPAGTHPRSSGSSPSKAGRRRRSRRC